MPTTLPTISIVVPNYNSGSTIARTLSSLIEQDYPALEIIVMDGGSTDNSVEIIRSFENQITSWVSEKDRGQSNAINNGFAKCTGEIVNWLCSDDRLLPGALHTIGRYFAEHPEADVIAGACRYVYLAKNIVHMNRPTAENFPVMPIINVVGQAACFYRRKCLDRPGPLREELHYAMDMELWCHFRATGRKWAFLDEVLAEAIEDGNNKTSTGGLKIVAENRQIYNQYCPERISLPWWYVHLLYPLGHFMNGGAPAVLRSIARFFRRASTASLASVYGMQRVKTMECWGQFFEAQERT
jgi:glycosyltransferase involved in cell wall biosynthesis